MDNTSTDERELGDDPFFSDNWEPSPPPEEREEARATNVTVDPSANSNNRHRIEIPIQEEVEATVSAAIGALAENPRTELYQRAHRLVKVVSNSPRNITNIKNTNSPKYRSADAPIIVDITVPCLREAVDRSAYCYKNFVIESTDKEGNKKRAFGKKKILPPNWLLEGIIARGEWPFPRIEGVTETPTLRPDGTILEKLGHDELTGLLYYSGSCSFEKVPENFRREQCVAAVEELAEIFVDFPFKEECDRSAALAAAITTLVRPYIAGCVPLFAVRATTKGSGKTLLVNAIETLRSGRREMATMCATKDIEEERKQMLAIAKAAKPVTIIDNVKDSFGSPVLDGVLTNGIYEARALGTNDIQQFNVKTIWFITGNNVAFRGDLDRRVIPIDLEPLVENPSETRTEFTHGQGLQLLEYIKSKRALLIPALLAAVKYYIDMGFPRAREPLMGSFETWDKLIVGFLRWVGRVDPLLTRARLKDAGDSEGDDVRGLFQGLAIAYPDRQEFTVAELLQRLATDRELESVVLEVISPRRGTSLSVSDLAYRFRPLKGRIAGGYKLIYRKNHSARLWSLQKW